MILKCGPKKRKFMTITSNISPNSKFSSMEMKLNVQFTFFLIFDNFHGPNLD